MSLEGALRLWNRKVYYISLSIVSLIIIVLGVAIQFLNFNGIPAQAALADIPWEYACSSDNQPIFYQDNVAFYNDHFFVMDSSWGTIKKIDTSCNIVATSPIATAGFAWGLTAGPDGVYVFYDRGQNNTADFGNGITYDPAIDFTQFGILKLDENLDAQWFEAPTFNTYGTGTSINTTISVNGNNVEITRVDSDICLVSDTSGSTNDGSGFVNFDPTVLYCVDTTGATVIEEYLDGNTQGQDQYIHEIVRDNTGNYYFTVTIRGSTSFDIGGQTINTLSTNTSETGSDVWLISTDSSFNYQWGSMLYALGCTSDIQIFGDGGIGFQNGEVIVASNITSQAGNGDCFFDNTFTDQTALNTEHNANTKSYGLITRFDPSNGTLNSYDRIENVTSTTAEDTVINDTIFADNGCMYVVGFFDPTDGVQYTGDNSTSLTGTTESEYFLEICNDVISTFTTLEGTTNNEKFLMNQNGYIVLSGEYNVGETIDFGVSSYTVQAGQRTYVSAFPISSGRILDCRLPSDPNNANSPLVNVAPIIEPNYVKTGTDQFGLALMNNGDIVTLNGVDRTLYGGGGPTNQSNTNINLYSQPLSFTVIEPADPVNSPSTPGITDTTTLTSYFGRPMDIETRSFNGTNVIYIYALRAAIANGPTSQPDPNTVLSVNSDLNGEVVGYILEFDPTNVTFNIVADNLPAAGYAKSFADMSIDASGNIYIDDVRVAYTPTNDYANIPRVDSAGALTTPFAQPTTNTFYDIASDDAGNAYSLIGSTDPSVRDKTGVYQIDSTGNVTDLGLAFPVNSDGGDLEVADADDTYDTTLTGSDWIYYTTGYGTANDASLVRISNDGSVITKSNDNLIDANFTSANTGYMDKVVFDYANQIIYYKNGSRSDNDPDQTIGKIYCPTQDQVDNPLPPNPGPDPDPEDPNDPSEPGEPGTNSDDPGNGGGGGNTPEVTISKTSSANGNVNTGDTITYTLTLTNNGTADATGVTIGDYIDADVTFSGTQSCTGDFTNCSYDSGTRLLTWSGITITPSQTINLTFGVIVN